VQTRAPSSIAATFHVLASSVSAGIAESASSRSLRVSDGAAWGAPARVRTSTRRTLVSTTVARTPNAKQATAEAV